MYFWLIGAIFDFQHARTYDCIPSSLSVLPGPGNKSVAVRIVLLTCIRTEIYVMSYLFRLMSLATIFNLIHTQAYDSIPSSLDLLSDPGNTGVAVGISLLSCIRAEIYVISYPLPVSGRHLCFTT